MAKDDRGEYEEDVCTCCRVHTTWRERPLPKHEVTIDHIARVNKLYSELVKRIVKIDEVITEYGIYRSLKKMEVAP